MMPLNEDSIRAALTESRGDLFRAAFSLGTSSWELEKLIRRSESLQSFALAMQAVKCDPAYDKWSADQFASEIGRLTSQFALIGLMTIHDIATGTAESAAEKDVKLKAAVHLRNAAPHRGDRSMDALLHELNQEYQRAAPRIKEIRTTTVVLEAPKVQNVITQPD